ncbi:MAG: cytochrome c [Myxococcales bacterium]|nr:cytochrome c [Myxococcales bacterium]
MKRRTLLRLGGVGLVAAGGGWLLARDRIARWRLAQALEAKLAPLVLGAGVLDAFLADVARHDAALLERGDAVLDLLAGRLLLSTDAFTRTSEGPLSYRVYANVYVNACVNPFARFVERAPREPRAPEEVYRAVCASCHDADAPRLDGVGSRLGDELEEVLRHGRGGMPSARALGLDAREENAIVTWLRGR